MTVVCAPDSGAELREVRVQQAITGLRERRKSLTRATSRHCMLEDGGNPNGLLEQSVPEQFNTRGVYARAELLRDCSAAFLSDLSNFAGPQRQNGKFYDIHAVIAEAGAPANSMFIVHRGELEVFVSRGEDPLILGEGQTFGEATLLGMEPRRPATVRAKTMCHLFEVTCHAFMRSLQQHAHERRRFEVMRRNQRRLHGLDAEAAPRLKSDRSPKLLKPLAFSSVLPDVSASCSSGAASSSTAAVDAGGRSKVLGASDKQPISSPSHRASGTLTSGGVKLLALRNRLQERESSSVSASAGQGSSEAPKDETASTGASSAVSAVAAALRFNGQEAAARKTVWFRPPETDQKMPERLKELNHPDIADRPPFWWRNVKRPATPEDMACIDALKRSLRLDSRRGFLLVPGAVPGNNPASDAPVPAFSELVGEEVPADSYLDVGLLPPIAVMCPAQKVVAQRQLESRIVARRRMRTVVKKGITMNFMKRIVSATAALPKQDA
mmetsp:Transcript_51080/g.94496  ORF Transcript_51080/g.94496 Transcript_51080/m.94496 type:complete len:497 (-) Transcript_51080:102-1592(-)